MPVEIECLQRVVSSGSRSYPLYVGFIKAEDIPKIAEAPSFRKEQSHEELASGVLKPPVKDWQRPLDPERYETIESIFNDTGELMPNPVLLSQNGVSHDGGVKILPKTREGAGSGGDLTGTFIVRVDEKTSSGEKPLWILDGQHRIAGLANSAQNENDVPVVLLLNSDAGGSYNGSDFAHLFAQVTTTAKGLDPIHQAWLTFAYSLEEYADGHTDFEAHRKAMRAVCQMCESPKLLNGQVNPFQNLIRFNPEQPAGKAPFARNCNELKAFLFKHYYGLVREPLEPETLADQLGKALRALSTVIMDRQTSVFFGDDDFASLPMQDAFLIGVMAYLREHPPPDDWELVLKGLQFHKTDWNFRAWVKSMGGKDGTDSRNVAEAVFSKVFADNALPEEETLDEYLKGNGARVTFQFSHLNSNGNPIKRDRKEQVLMPGENRSHGPTKHRHVKIDRSWRTTNVARIEVVDADSNPANPRKLPSVKGSGYKLDGSGESLDIGVSMHFFGGLAAYSTLTVKW